MTQRHLLSASRDRTVALWEVDSWTLTNKSRAQINWINALEVFEGEILSGSESAFVQTWGIRGRIKTLESHDQIVTSLVVLRDGFLASACIEGFIKIWDLKNYSLVTTFKGHSDFIHSMIELKNGFLASGSFAGSIKIWNTVSWKEERTLNPPFKFVSVTALPNGSLACRTLGSIRILDANDGHEVLCLATLDVPLSLAVLPGNILAVGCSSGRIQILDPADRSRNERLQMKSNNSVTSIVAMENNQAFASGNAEGNISIWSMKDWTESFELKEEEILISLAAYSDDLLISGHESSIIIWHATDGTKLNQLNKSHGTYSLATSPGGTVASGDLNGKIYAWNSVRLTQISELSKRRIETLRVLDDQDSASDEANWFELTDPIEKSKYYLNGGVLAMKFIAKTDLVIGTRDNEIRNYFYRFDNSKQILEPKELAGLKSSINSITANQDHSLVHGSLENDIFVMNVCEKSGFKRIELSKIVPSKLIGYALEDDRFILAGFEDGSIVFWDIKNDCSIFELEGENDFGPMTTLSFFEPKILVAGFESGLIKVWVLDELLDTYFLNGFSDESSPSKEVTQFTVLDRGLLASSCLDNTIKIWNRENWTEVQTLNGYKPVRLVVLNNGYLASGNDDGSVIVWNSNDWTEFRRLTGFKDYSVSSLIVLSNDFLVSSSRGGVKIWDTIDWTEVKTPEEFQFEEKSLLPIQNGYRVCSMNQSAIVLEDFHLSRHLTVIKSHTDWVTSLAYLKDSYIASGSKDSTIKIWNAADWSKIRTLREHQGSVNALAVIRDEYLVSGSSDKKIIVWDNFNIVLELRGHTDSVTSLAVSPTGLLASGSDDRTVRIWSLNSRNVAHVLSSHSDSVTSLVFISDQVLASGSADGSMCVWRTEDGRLVKSQKKHKFQITALVLIDTDSADENQGQNRRHLSESDTQTDV